jgi:GT2 family glycosyltransferase
MDVDVVVVAYRSRAHLRDCVEPLCGAVGGRVVVVDNDCPEQSVETVRDLDLEVVDMGRNAGFGAGCNAGASRGSAAAVLFLNPDARIDPEAVRTLAEAITRDARCAAAGPRVSEADGSTEFSMRREPRLRSAFAEAVFLHHLLPRTSWASEIVRTGYDVPQEVDWLTGAALLVRRDVFEEIGGFDERLFMYSEDVDIGTRIRGRGYVLRYEPAAVAWHEGGGSAPRPSQAPVRAAARISYVRLHERGLRYAAFRLAYALEELLRIPVALLRSPMHLKGRFDAFRVSAAPGVAWVDGR